MPEVVHKFPTGNNVIVPCCGKRMKELPRKDQITAFSKYVTCDGKSPLPTGAK